MANELESLLSKSEINFPQRMTGSQVRDMFGYISKRGKYEIELRVEQTEKFRYEQQGAHPEPEIQELTGSINERGNLVNSSSFRIKQELDHESDLPVFTRLEFETIPGYNLEEHRKEEIRLWENTRTKVLDYFDNCYKS